MRRGNDNKRENTINTTSDTSDNQNGDSSSSIVVGNILDKGRVHTWVLQKAAPGWNTTRSMQYQSTSTGMQLVDQQII